MLWPAVPVVRVGTSRRLGCRDFQSVPLYETQAINLLSQASDAYATETEEKSDSNDQRQMLQIHRRKLWDQILMTYEVLHVIQAISSNLHELHFGIM